MGMVLSVYLTIAHLAGTDVLACSDTGVINCAKVTTSPESVFLHVPVVFYGLLYFVVSILLNSPWSFSSRRLFLHRTRVAWASLGMAFVMWLLYAELVVVKNICLYCSAVHVVTFALFVLNVLAWPVVTNQFLAGGDEGEELVRVYEAL